MKAAPVLKWASPEERHVAPEGAVAELWKICSEEIVPSLTQVVRAAGHRVGVPNQCKDGETVFLRKPKGDGSYALNHYRALNILAHIGKMIARLATAPCVKAIAARVGISVWSIAGKSNEGCLGCFRRVAEAICKYKSGGTQVVLRGGYLVRLRESVRQAQA